MFKEDTVILHPDEGYDTVISADDDNAIYVIENPDETLLSLQVGDVFSYTYDENNVLIVKIAEMTLSDNTLTITGAKTDITSPPKIYYSSGI